MGKAITILAVLAAFSAGSAWASHPWTGPVKVATVQLDSNGDALITLTEYHADTVCGPTGNDQKRYRISYPASEPEKFYNGAYAMALTAVSSGADVYLRGNGCSGTIPTVRNIRIDN